MGETGLSIFRERLNYVLWNFHDNSIFFSYNMCIFLSLSLFSFYLALLVSILLQSIRHAATVPYIIYTIEAENPIFETRLGL